MFQYADASRHFEQANKKGTQPELCAFPESDKSVLSLLLQQ